MRKLVLLASILLLGLTPAQKRLLVSEPSCDQIITQAGPTLWLDAEYGITATATNTVSAWASRVGAVTFTQATAGHQPSLTNADGRENWFSTSENNTGWEGISRATFSAPITIVNDSTAANTHGVYKGFSLINGSTYVYSFSFLKSAGTGHIQAVVGSAGAYLTDSCTIQGSPSGWVGTPTVAADGSYCRFTGVYTSGSTGTVYARVWLTDATYNVTHDGDGTTAFAITKLEFRSSLADPTYIATTTYPVYRGLNGRRAVRFDGSNDGMSAADFFGTDAATIFVTSRSNGGAASGAGRFLDNGKLIYYSNDAGDQIIFSSDAANFANGLAGAYVINKPTVSTLTRTAAGVANHYYNGLLSGAADQASGSPASATTALILGNRNALDRAHGGDLQTLLTFNKVLPSDTRAKINRCLCKKSGGVVLNKFKATVNERNYDPTSLRPSQ